MAAQELTIRGVRIFPGHLDRDRQRRIAAQVREAVARAPMVSPVTPGGKPMSVRMTSAGSCGWVTDRSGYRYEPKRPDGGDWPEIPESVLEVWRELASREREPDCCLINHYSDGARMGMHQDRDEADFGWPVLSISLGDDGLFRIGSDTRGGKTESIWLRSGDAVLLAGESRLKYHGLDRIRPGSSTLLPEGGRINLTLRVVH